MEIIDEYPHILFFGVLSNARSPALTASVYSPLTLTSTVGDCAPLDAATSAATVCMLPTLLRILLNLYPLD